MRSLNTRIGTNSWINDVLPKDLYPGGVMMKMRVELGSNLGHLFQLSARDRGEVMVLNVVANPEGDPIEGTIVGASLWDHVMPLLVHIDSRWILLKAGSVGFCLFLLIVTVKHDVMLRDEVAGNL